MTALPPDARVLVTGAAGFIGHAVSAALLDRGVQVTGADDLSESYYAADLKRRRLDTLAGRDGFAFRKVDLAEPEQTRILFEGARPTHVVHLAAQAAVMPSFEDPMAYVRSNVVATQVVLEEARRAEGLRHLVYASTSSVYGSARAQRPFREDQPTDTPISVYGASKVANEAMMQAYFARYDLAVTGLRFFKVYGPWGRPDTVFFKFVDRVHRGEVVRLHNHGDVTHAFTYIGDVVGGVLGALARIPDTGTGARHPIYNLGNPDSQKLGYCLELIEKALGIEARKELVPLPKGDRFFSIADVSRARAEIGYEVRVPVEEGIPRLVAWYLEHAAGAGRLDRL